MFRQPEAEQGDGEPQAEHRIGNGDAGEEEKSEAGEQDERGVEAGAGAAKGPPRECLHREGEGENSQRERNAGRGCADSEELEAGGHRPVEQRRLLQVANAVGVERDPIVAQEHLARDLGVDRVGVVQQGGTEESEAGVKDDPEREQEESVGQRTLRDANLWRG